MRLAAGLGMCALEVLSIKKRESRTRRRNENLLDDPSFGVVTPEILQGRKYLFIRPIGDTPEESGSAAQKRIAKEFFGALEEWEVV